MPSIDRLIELSMIFHVPLNYLVGIEKEKSIVIEHLTQRHHNKKSQGLSERQQDILNAILIEFNS